MVIVDLFCIQSVWMGYKGELGELLVSVWIFPNLPTVQKRENAANLWLKMSHSSSGLSRKARLVPDGRKAFAATRSQSRRGPVWGGGTGESHYGCATNKSAAAAATKISEERFQHLVAMKNKCITEGQMGSSKVCHNWWPGSEWEAKDKAEESQWHLNLNYKLFFVWLIENTVNRDIPLNCVYSSQIFQAYARKKNHLWSTDWEEWILSDSNIVIPVTPGFPRQLRTTLIVHSIEYDKQRKSLTAQSAVEVQTAKKTKTNAKQKEKENIWANRWSRFNGNARNWLGALCEVTLSEQCLCAASGWRSPGQWLICAGCFTRVFSSAGSLQFFMPVHKLWRLLFILFSDSRTGKLLCSSETLSQRQFGGGMSPCLKAPPPTSIALFLLLLLLLFLLPHLTDEVTPGCVNRSRQRQ